MLSVEDVKKRTKCRRCLQKGHWARDCPSTQSFEANFSWSGHLLYLFLFSLYLLCLYLYYLISFFQVTWSRIISASAARSTTPSTTSWLTKVRWSESLIEIYEGCVLVDTAAGHPTCGGSYFDALERGLNKHGIKSVIISSNVASIPTRARGVGGIAQTKEVRLIPMRLGNATMFVELLVLKSEVPPLLSVTLFEKCVIDLQRNVITWNSKGRAPCESVMHSLKSKHRAVDVSDFKGVEFIVPERVLSKYGVKTSDFAYPVVRQDARNCFFASDSSNRDGAGGAASTRTDTLQLACCRHRGTGTLVRQVGQEDEGPSQYSGTTGDGGIPPWQGTRVRHDGTGRPRTSCRDGGGGPRAGAGFKENTYTSGQVLVMPGVTDLPSLEYINAQFLNHNAY